MVHAEVLHHDCCVNARLDGPSAIADSTDFGWRHSVAVPPPAGPAKPQTLQEPEVEVSQRKSESCHRKLEMLTYNNFSLLHDRLVQQHERSRSRRLEGSCRVVQLAGPAAASVRRGFLLIWRGYFTRRWRSQVCWKLTAGFASRTSRATRLQTSTGHCEMSRSSCSTRVAHREHVSLATANFS